ncbi:MAG TPA: FecR domain-containing protein [Hyphomicrobiaceae bacterium]|nr:FecR domain-containing protein [Hyphomicrobiaceae bacterium]
MFQSLRSVVTALAAALAWPAPAAAQQVGTAGAVNPAAQASGRVLHVGSNVLFREVINTTNTGTVQIIFLDKTTLSVGPNSNLVIDEFVYDPNAGSGRMTVSLAKGILRIVGGSVTHTGGATVKTPVATVGVRGGVQTTSHLKNTTSVVNHFGSSTITSGGTTQSIYRPGFGSSTSGKSPPSPPSLVPHAQIAATLKQLTSFAGQTGGALKVPTNAVVQGSGLGKTNANLIPGKVKSIQGQTVSQNVLSLPEDLKLGEIDWIVRRAEQLDEQAAPAPVFFALQTTGTPYLPAYGFETPGMFVSPLFGFRPGGVDGEGNPRFGSATLQAGLAVSGTGKYQTSTFFVMAGEFITQSADGTLQLHSGGFTSTTRLDADEGVGRASGNADSEPASETVDANRIPTAVTLNQDRRDPTTGGVTPATATFFNGKGGPPISYTYSDAFTQVPVPKGVGQERSGVQLTGFVGGLMQTRHAASPAHPSWPIGRSFPVAGGIVIDFEPNNGTRFQAVASIEKVANFNGLPNEFSSAVLQIGNLDPSARNTGTYIDDHLFGGIAAVNEAPGIEPVTQLSTVNGSPLSKSQQAFATSKVVNGDAVIAALGANPKGCVCEYTRWGFWSVDTARANPYGSEERDRAHLMTWVAGRKSNPVDIPMVGKATYNGFMAGTFKNGVNEYLAAGNFSYSADFGNPAASTMSVPNLDGVAYSGNVPFNRSTNSISGSISGYNVNPYGPLQHGSATMALDGAFFRGKTDPIKDVAGRFTVTGNPVNYPAGNFRYIGGGIFAGSR